MLAAQAVVDAERPAFEVGEEAMRARARRDTSIYVCLYYFIEHCGAICTSDIAYLHMRCFCLQQ